MRQLPRLLRPRRLDGTDGDGSSVPDEPRIEMVEARGLRWYHVQDPGSADFG